MKKIGTITTAIGFIYLGVWMIIDKVNPNLAKIIFNFWPLLIIMLGVELLLHYMKNDNEEGSRRTGFNFLSLLMIAIFLCVALYNGIAPRIKQGINNLRFHSINSEYSSIFDDFDSENYKKIDLSNTFNTSTNKVYIDFNNAEVKVYKSNDNNIKFESKIYIKNDSSMSKDELEKMAYANSQNSKEDCKINLKDNNIGKAVISLYVPDGDYIYLNGNNLKVSSNGELKDVGYNINGNNGSIDLNGGKELELSFNNGNINVDDVKTVKVESNNGAVNLNGDVDSIDIRTNNGGINVNNKSCKSLNIDVKVGAVKVRTQEKDIDANLDINVGPCAFNGEKRVNSGIIKTLGNGTNKFKIHVGTGAIDLND